MMRWHFIVLFAVFHECLYQSFPNGLMMSVEASVAEPLEFLIHTHFVVVDVVVSLSVLSSWVL